MTGHPTLPFDNRQGPSHRNAPETSRLAALANEPRSGTQRARVLMAIYRHGWPRGAGLTNDEIVSYTKLPENSVRPRRRELVQGGFVKDSGERRGSDLGNDAVVWRLTEKGLRAAKRLSDA